MNLNHFSIGCLKEVLDKTIQNNHLKMNISGSQLALSLTVFMRDRQPNYYGIVREFED